jgi:hypothetical protein
MKPSTAIRPDWLENREGKRTRAKTPETLALAGGGLLVFAARGGNFAAAEVSLRHGL